jgi:hypothetical protein
MKLSVLTFVASGLLGHSTAATVKHEQSATSSAYDFVSRRRISCPLIELWLQLANTFRSSSGVELLVLLSLRASASVFQIAVSSS